MGRTLWIAIVSMALFLMVEAGVSIQYKDCPKDCKCEKKMMASVMSCRTFFTEDLVGDMPITKFELSSQTPIELNANIFSNMGLKHVNVISIFNTTIDFIDKDAFNGLPDLGTIKITHSKITELHPETFKNVPNLNKLNLSGNPLAKNIVISSDNLEELLLSHCGLSEISSEMFQNLSSLSLLDLTGNGIKMLSPNVFDSLTKITEIRLAHNKIKNLPNEVFSKTSDLSTLDLGYNPLTTFTSQIINLEALNLKGCLLKEVDDKMFKNMSLLYSLNLSNNKITNIDPSAFNDLEDIAYIDLSDNDLHSLSEILFSRNKNLQKLNLDNNIRLTKLPSHGFKSSGSTFSVYYFSCNNCNLRSLDRDTFKSMPGLVTLLLSNNKIDDISTGVFYNLTSLIELDLSHNQITTIDDETFKKNTGLKNLSLGYNTLKAFHASMFKYNENLKTLDISNCGLYQIWTDSTKIHIPSLESLNASNNDIKIIKKDDIVITNHLKSLDISNNPLLCTSDLMDLVTYLEVEEIKNGNYFTHENLAYNFEAMEKEENSWMDLGRSICPGFFHEEQNDLDDEEYEEEAETSDYSNADMMTETNDFVDEMITYEDISSPVKSQKDFRYSAMWPVLVFLGTALVVLGLVANFILFVIRRRQSMPLPRIINVPRMSRLKKNSGLVYQQLSEEHGTKTPILTRLTVPIHGGNPDSEHV